MHTPHLGEDEKQSTTLSGQKRFQEFLDQVSRRLAEMPGQEEPADYKEEALVER
jgi:hypothetical protein